MRSGSGLCEVKCFQRSPSPALRASWLPHAFSVALPWNASLTYIRLDFILMCPDCSHKLYEKVEREL